MNIDDASKSPRRAYRSALRAEQAQATRERILDAVEARIRSGDRELGVAAIAREARVGVATVYRHFPDRQALYEAIVRRADGQYADADWSSARLEDVLEGMRVAFARFDDPADPLHGAHRLSALFDLSRAVTVPRRRQLMSRLLEAHAPGLREPERTWVLDLAVVLVSSAMVEAMRGYLDRSGAEAAERVAFGLRALFDQARALSREEVR